MYVSEAVKSRFSCRAFTEKPVSKELIKEILDVAKQAPSGGNLQPWHIHAISGKKLDQIVSDIESKIIDMPMGEKTEYDVYPPNLWEPYRSRRFKCGEDLYKSINIPREDKGARLNQLAKNLRFFGAPVGLFVYIDRKMGPPQWSDVGMFLQTVMLIAREKGLHSCAQEAWAMWHSTVNKHLVVDNNLMLFCGMGIGYADENHPINSWRTDREAVNNFTTFYGFEK
mgnify:FL=1